MFSLLAESFVLHVKSLQQFRVNRLSENQSAVGLNWSNVFLKCTSTLSTVTSIQGGA